MSKPHCRIVWHNQVWRYMLKFILTNDFTEYTERPECTIFKYRKAPGFARGGIVHGVTIVDPNRDAVPVTA